MGKRNNCGGHKKLALANFESLEQIATSGCSIPVVRLLWEQIDWVRFPASRPFDSFFADAQNSLMVYDPHLLEKFHHRRVECPEPVEGQWFVYLLECKNNSLYCGSTNNPARRIHDRNSGSAAQWTKMRRPVQLVYFEIWDSLLKARRREKQIKGWSHIKKTNLIEGKWGKLKF